MNEELTLQDLIDLLVKRHDMERADAEAFVKLFFSLIEKGLSEDKYVKIKGLGAFKLIDTRVTFTPDSSMKDSVNKPFSHFETVVLNDDAHFADMPEREPLVADVNVDEPVRVGQNPGPASVKSLTPGPVHVEISEPSPATVEPKSVKTESSSALSAGNPLVQPEAPKKNSSFLSRLPWCMIASLLLAGVIAGGFMTWSLYCTSENLKLASYEQIEPVIVAEEDTVAKDTLVDEGFPEQNNEDEVAGKKRSVVLEDGADYNNKKKNGVKKDVERKPVVKKVEQKQDWPLSDAVTYTAVGTSTVHRLKDGESLIKLARKYYGNKKLWPYIAHYNNVRLKEADNIHVGTMIRIPRLVPQKSR